MANRTPAQLAAERRYRQTERGRETERLKKRRKRARDPQGTAAKVRALELHGKRVAEIKRERLARNDPPLPMPSVADTRKKELQRLSAAIRDAKHFRDREASERLEREYSLLAGPPKKRPIGDGIVGMVLTDTDLDDLLLG